MAWGVAATARHSDGLLVSFGKRSKFRESVRKPFAGRLDVLCAQESLALRIHSPNFPPCCAKLGMEQPPTSRIAWRGSSAGSSVLDAKHIPPTSMAAISGWSTHRLSIGTRSADTLVRSSEELTRHTYQLPDRPRRSGSFLYLVSLTLRRAGRSARNTLNLKNDSDFLEYLRF
jgi:hypothetical protein